MLSLLGVIENLIRRTYKTILSGLLSLCAIGSLFYIACDTNTYARVKRYYRKDGTYIRPHYRSNPDGNPHNNWSFPGNVNPFTGKVAPGNPGTYLKNYYKKPAPPSCRVPKPKTSLTLKFSPQVSLLTRLLYQEIRNGDVTKLQRFAVSQDSDIYPEKLITSYFGPLTEAAVVHFQEKYTNNILAPWSLIRETEIVGITTRAKINGILLLN